jgi:plasmid stabilization system protein ParE
VAKVRWTEPALADLEEALNWISGDSPAAAKKIRTKIKARVRQLRRFPRIGRRVPDFDVDHIREILVHPFRNIYLVK